MTTRRLPVDPRARFLAVVAFVGIAALLMGSGWWFYWSEHNKIRQANVRQLAAVGELKAIQIREWRMSCLKEANRAAADELTRKIVERVLANAAHGGVDLGAELMGELVKEDYANVLLYDASLNLLFAQRDFNGTLNAEPVIQKNLRAALAGREAVMSPFYTSTNGVIHIDVAVAVRDRSNQPLAVLVLRRHADRILDDLARFWPGESPSMEVVLAQKEAAEVFFVNRLRLADLPVAARRFSLQRTELPAVQAVLGRQGIIEGKDYRGVAVLTDARPISGTPWFLVCKLDHADIHAEARFWLLSIGTVTGALILLVAGVLTYFYRRRQLLIFMELQGAEQERLEAEAGYFQLFEGMLDGFALHEIICDAAGQPVDYRFLSANPAFEKMTGLRPADVVGRTVREIMPDTEPIWIERYGRVAQTGEGIVFEDYSAALKRHFEIAAFRPKAGLFATVFIDITERKLNEAVLRENEERYRSLFEGATDGVFLMAVDGSILAVNEAFARMHGYTVAEMQGVTLKDLDTPESYAGVAERRRRLLAGESLFFEVEHYHKDGHVFPLEVSASLVRHGDESVIQVFHRDITVRRQLERDLKRANRLYAVLGQFNQTMLRTDSRQDLFQAACRIAVQQGQFRMAWIGLLDAATGQVVPQAFAGHEDGYLSRRIVSIAPDSPLGHGPTGTAIRTGEVVVNDSFQKNPRMAPWREDALKQGYQSSASVPFKLQGKVIGSFTIYASEPDFFSGEEQGLLVQIGADISHALGRLQLQAEREEVKAALLANERRFRAAINSFPVPVALNDERLNITFLNPAFVATFGYTLEDIPTLAEWFPKAYPDPEYRQSVLTEWQLRQAEVKATGGQFRPQEVFVCCKDGSTKSILISAAPLTDRLFAAENLVVLYDISERKLAEKAIQRYETIFKHAGWGMVMTDPVSNAIVQVNPAYARMHGYKVEEMVGLPVAKTLSPDFQSKYLEHVKTAHRQGFLKYESIHIRKDGTRFPCLTDVTVFKDDAGQVLFRAATVEDITERKLAEVSINALAMRNQTLLQTASDGIHVLDIRGNVVEVNVAFCRMLGYTREEMLRLNVKDWDTQWTASELQAKVRELVGQPEGVVFETKHRRKDGSMLLVEINAAGVRLEGRQFLYAAARDITAHKQAEQKLAESESYLSAIIHAEPECIKIVDSQGRLTMMNPAGLAMLEAESEKQVVGKKVLTVIAPEHHPAYAELHRRVLAGESARLEYEIIGLTGKRRWVETHAVPMHRHGQVMHLGVTRDITARKQAETALERVHQRNELILRAVAEGVVGLDLEGRQTFVNPAAAAMLGYAPDELIGHPSHRLWHHTRPDGSPFPESECAICATLQDGSIHQMSSEVFWRKDGTSFPVEYAARPIHEEGRLIGAVVTFTDITGYRQAEKTKLLQSSALNAAANAIWITDPNGQIEWINPAATALTGYTLEECLGKNPRELVKSGRQEDAFYRQMWETILGGAVWRGKVINRRKDGGLYTEHETITPVRDAQGQITHFIAVKEDITEREAAEVTLRLESAALEAAANSIIITDYEGKIEWVNAAFTLNSGYTIAEVIGKKPGLFKSGQHDAAFYKNIWDTVQAGEVWHGEIINRRKNGTLYTEEMTITPLPDEEGRITHFIAVKQDVTEKKLLEEQFRQSQKMEAFGQLAGGVAHDFNNILAAMIMQTDVTGMAEGITEEIQEGLRQIRADADRATSLTRQLLLFSRKQVMQQRELDLNASITNLAKMLQRIIGENVRLHLDLDSRPLLTRADAGMLDQLLMNLVVNARDAMPDGGKIVITTAEKDFMELTGEEAAQGAKPGRYVCMKVADTGTGIAPEHLPRIFEPFFTTKEQGKGTGLGLATVFGIVQQHGGIITVHSQLGQGTAFNICLPALAATSKAVAAANAQPKPRGGKETILLVEDEANLRALIRTVLKKNGYEVMEAADGVEALQVWEQHASHIHLLLTDMVMPEGIGGRELGAQLRRTSPRLPIIFTSGYTAEVSGVDISLQAGESFMQKPVSPQELLETVRKALDGAPGKM